VRFIAFVAVVAAVLPHSTQAIAQEQRVGVTATAHAPATGTPPQSATRELFVGLDMVRNERIVTGAEGKTQLLFVDGSALTIGPNAELVLDEFVYDPQTETGKLAMTAAKGVFRVVGGKISKTEAITLKTPTATLGIRGGIAMAQVGGGSGFFGFLFGKQMTVDGTGADGQPTRHVVTRPGTGVPLGPGGTVLSPVPIPQELINSQRGVLEGNRGQSGGASERPTDARVASAELGSLGSDISPEVIGAEPAAGGDAASGGPGQPTGLDLAVISQFNLQNFLSSSSSGALSATSPVAALAQLNLSGRYKSTPGSGSAAGTAGDGTPSFDRPFDGAGFIGNQFMATIGSDTFSAPVSATGGFLSYTDSEASSPFGPIAGTSFVSPNRDFVFFESLETDFFDERSFLFAGVPTPAAAIPASGFAAYSIRRDFVGNTNIPFIPAAAGGSLTGTVSPAFIGFTQLGGQRPFLQASIAIVGSGGTQSSVVSLLIGSLTGGGPTGLLGQMRGSSRLSGDPSFFFDGAAGFATDPAGNGFFGATAPDYFVLESNGPGGRGVRTSDISLAESLYYPNNVASRAPVPGIGASSERHLPGLHERGFAHRAYQP
jgi:hypothetical protein